MQYCVNTIGFRRRKQLVTAAAAILVFFAVWCFVVPLFARAAGEVTEEAVLAILLRMFNETTTSLIDKIHGISNGDNAIVVSTIHTISNVTMVLGYILIIYYTVSSILREFVNGRANTDTWIAVFTRFVIACFIIALSEFLISQIEYLGANLIDAVKGLLQDVTHNDGLTPEAMQAASDMLDGERGYVLVFTLLTWYISFVRYAILIELVMRRALLALALTSIVDDGVRSPGMSFLKKYLALYVQMIVMMFALTIAAAILTAMMNGIAVTSGETISITYGIKTPSSVASGLGTVYDILAVFGASVVMISQSRTIANAIVGAR